MAAQPATIVDAFLRTADRSPDRLAVDFEGVSASYRDLARQSERWAGAFVGFGIADSDRIALFLDNSLDFLGAYLGVHRAGATVVLVNTQYRQVELRHILSDSGARVCVVDAARLSELARVVGNLPALEAIVVVGRDRSTEAGLAKPASSGSRSPVVADAADFLQEDRLVPKLPSPDDVALIAYTSGTTGRSKGAMLTHRNLTENSRAVTQAWSWTENDRLLLTLPLFHIHGLGVGVNGTFLVGGSIDLRRRFDPVDVLDTLGRGEGSMFFGVPTMYSRLIAEVRKRSGPPPAIRLYVSGSAPLSAQTFEEFAGLFGLAILERYGMTETVMNLTNPYDGERRAGTVGQPFPGQEARIVDLGTRVPILDEGPGEIQVRGPHVFRGYWGQPEATAASFDASGWFNTGDLGWRSSDGYYAISGRARELIITGGYNIYPREVEEVLSSHPGVEEAAVLGLPDADFGEQVVAIIVLKVKNASGPSSEELIALCRDQLASYKKPRKVYFVDRLPRNALGKVQKHLLRDQIERG
jgi:malonyl-CoA/methylmalonyl-CoA synthetase